MEYVATSELAALEQLDRQPKLVGETVVLAVAAVGGRRTTSGRIWLVNCEMQLSQAAENKRRFGAGSLSRIE